MKGRLGTSSGVEQPLTPNQRGVIASGLMGEFALGREALKDLGSREGFSEVVRRENSVSVGTRSELEVWYTLVKDGVVPVRNKMMTNAKAKSINLFNRQNGIRLVWVMGKQEIPK